MDSIVPIVVVVAVLLAGFAAVRLLHSRTGMALRGRHLLVSLRKEKIIDRWSMVLEGAAGSEEYLVGVIIDGLLRSELPGVRWSWVDVAPGLVSGVLGRRHRTLCVQNRELRDFRMYVCVRDYGRHLAVTWFLTVEPGLLKRIASLVLTRVFLKRGDVRTLSFDLDLFAEQELRAFATTVHRCCVKRAVSLLAANLNQEVSNFDWQSRGFLELW